MVSSTATRPCDRDGDGRFDGDDEKETIFISTTKGDGIHNHDGDGFQISQKL